MSDGSNFVDWIGKRKDALSKKTKSKDVKEAKKGKDFGKKNGKNSGFKNVEKKAAKEYGSDEAGKRVAAAEFWKMQAKKK